jgi:cyclophilin family peptidyl-prolyl cis-trans isomerase
MAQGFLKGNTAGLIVAGLIFLGSFWYLIDVAFDSREVFSASKSELGAVFDVVMHTSEGDIVLQFYPSKASQTRYNFLSLASTGFYDDTKFHRVIKDVLIQGGDPYTKRADVSRYGTGDPGYFIKDEINDVPMKRGVVAMAHKGEKHTAGSQFFILASDRPDLQGRFTVFGFVSRGMDVVDRVSRLPIEDNERPRTPTVLRSIELRQ